VCGGNRRLQVGNENSNLTNSFISVCAASDHNRKLQKWFASGCRAPKLSDFFLNFCSQECSLRGYTDFGHPMLEAQISEIQFFIGARCTLARSVEKCLGSSDLMDFRSFWDKKCNSTLGELSKNMFFKFSIVVFTMKEASNRSENEIFAHLDLSRWI
jgi:hypothetical protein